jgi:type IV fimbrial biogenesis protein FimT
MRFVQCTVVGRRAALAHSRGFTLLELMVTVAVAGVLLTLGVPSFVDVVRNNRAATNVNELTTAFSIARSESIRRGWNVSVCRSSNSASITPTCSGAWSDGWIVFRDDAATDTAAPVVGEVLRSWPAMPGDATVVTFANAVAADIGWIRFAPRGVIRAAGASPIRYDIALAGCSGLQRRSVELNTVGRASVARVAC